VSTDRDESRTAPAGSDVYFAPAHREGVYLAFGGRVTWRRVLLRIAIFVAALALIDMAVAGAVDPPTTYEHDYRLPRVLPTASLPDFADAIDRAGRTRTGGPIALFLGASPTWGHRIKDAGSTYPAAFGTAARSGGRPMRVYNLASNGQFVTDYLAIAERLGPDADVVFVQLTYHTFNPVARQGAVMRYPELPRVLGLSLPADEARLLGGPVSGGPAVGARLSGSIDAWLSGNWLLWRERDVLNRRLFGGKPQAVLRDAVDRAIGGEAAPDEAADDGFASFDSLDPGRQMIVVSRYAENASFTLSRSDTEVEALRILVRRLAAQRKRAVFFMAPLNRELIESYALVDPVQYESNIAILRGIVTAQGFPFLDYNTGPVVVPSPDFVDISHTNDAGGRAVGTLLYRDTAAYLGPVTP
jgi:hypothetical protein